MVAKHNKQKVWERTLVVLFGCPHSSDAAYRTDFLLQFTVTQQRLNHTLPAEEGGILNTAVFARL